MKPTREAVRRGLLKFPPPGEVFPGRRTATKNEVVDTRGAGTDLRLRALIVNELRGLTVQCPAFDVVAGIARAGTPWAAWLAWIDGRPFATVLLDGPRQSGLQREVEGEVAGRRVLMIDNWVRSGGSLLKAVDVVRRAGAQPVAALAIVRSRPVDLGFPMHAAWELDELLEAASQEGLVPDAPFSHATSSAVPSTNGPSNASAPGTFFAHKTTGA